MRVAIVVNCLKLGGMERVAVSLSDAFAENGDDATLIYLKNRPQDIKPTSDVDVRLFDLKKSVLKTGIGAFYYLICKLFNVLISKTFPLLFAYPSAFFFKRKLQKLEAEKGKFDLVIFRGQGTFEQLWPLRDERFVYVCENIIKPHYYGALSSIVYRALFDCKNIVCVSKGAHDSFQSLTNVHNISPSRSQVISNPNNTAYIRKQAEIDEPDIHPRSFILGLGRLTQVKNFTLLVKAYSYLVEQHDIPQDLVIVGEGKDRENIEASVKALNLEHRVFFKGARKNPFPWFKHADLFVLSSQFEGLGMVLLEALACDTRIVCTDSAGGVRQIMDGDLEMYLSPQEPEILASKMYKSLTSSWSDKERAYIEEKLTEFSGEKIISEYKRFFMYNPKVSVIIPVYNVERFITQCLESVVNQTHENIEIICINDGSTDQSKIACEKYALDDNRVIVINQANKGLSGARNTGIKASTGEYLFFLDSDDWLDVKALENLINNSQGYDIVSGGVISYDEISGKARDYKKKRDLKIDIREDFFKLEIVVWNKLYRKDILKNIKFPEGLIHEDEEFYWQVFSMFPKVKVIRENVIFYRQRPGSITKNKNYSKEYQFNYINIVDHIYPLSKKNIELVYPFKKTCFKFLKQLKKRNAPYDEYEKHVNSRYGVEDTYTFKVKLRAIKLKHWFMSRFSCS